MERTFLLSQLLDSVLSGEKQFTMADKQPNVEEGIIESVKRRWPRSVSLSESAEISISAQVSCFVSLFLIVFLNYTVLPPFQVLIDK